MSKKQLFIVGLLMVFSVAVGAFLMTDFNRVPFGLAGPGDVKLGAEHAPITPSNEINVLNDAFVAVSKAVTPQVVSITVTSGRKPTSTREREGEQLDPFELFEQYQGRSEPQRGSGSGVIITSDGYILTNNHVVESAAANGISVELNDGRRFDGTLVGRDPLTDLAVVKIDAKDLPAAAFANSDDAQVGQIVMAVGNPLGLNSTVTQGIISALGRGQLNLNRDAQGYGVEDFIQTDAAINPGNSGGGLFNLSGALVGINSAIATRTGYYQGYGFAIPVNLARAVAQDLIDDGNVNRGYIGVRIANMDQKFARGLGLERAEGVLVQEVMPGSAAEQGGLRQGDVILEVDGQKVNTSNHLQSVVARKRSGDAVQLQVYRDGKISARSVTLRPRDDAKETPASRPTFESDPIERDSERNLTLPELGIGVRPLDPQTKKDRGVSGGILVSNIEIYGEAMNQGLMEGDVILSVNRTPVNSPAEFRKVVEAAATGDILMLQVKGKNDATRLVALEMKR
jgi:serine protease Do